jgi:hypothetical protein
VSGEDERREFPRLHATIYCRPRGFSLFKGRREPQDVSLGGIRIFSDEPMKLGTRLNIEMFVRDDDKPVVAGVEVVWIDELPADAPARFDVGLKFIDLSDRVVEKIQFFLETTTDP